MNDFEEFKMIIDHAKKSGVPVSVVKQIARLAKAVVLAKSAMEDADREKDSFERLEVNLTLVQRHVGEGLAALADFRKAVVEEMSK